jgi:nitroimidazol reductase NimA-like FMN-containing flavoprotein (pyridoxamine 5'-phosphate oxidase superfamily)
MFREMRRNRQLLSPADTDAVMARCTHGVLACLGDENYPYAVPLSYVYLNNRIYFHSAKEGHKIDAVIKHPKVSFSVIDEDTVAGDKFTTYYRSAIAFGKARIAEEDERLQALEALVEKYAGAEPREAKAKAVTGCSEAHIIAIDIEHMTGKESMEYVMAKGG